MAPRSLSVGPFAPLGPLGGQDVEINGDYWPVRDILTAIYEDGGRRPKKLLAIVDHPYLNSTTLAYYAWLQRYPFLIGTVAYTPPDIPLKEILEFVRSHHYLIGKEGGEDGPEFTNRRNKIILKRVEDSGAFIRIPTGVVLPDAGYPGRPGQWV